MRTDLLALTPDDLTALTNRGTVKRAQREIESAELTFELAETDAGEVAMRWSDDARCTFPAEKTVREGQCSCVATTLCRHLVRSILAYQAHMRQTAATAAGPAAPPAAAGDDAAATDHAERHAAKPWNPGDVSDEDLARHFKKSALAAAASKFGQGVLVELVRSAKPTARFHQLACTLRFLVPGDVRYTHCDCAEPAPCGHVPLAVWAFRRLAAHQSAGVVSTQESDAPVPTDVLDAADAVLAELAEDGIAHLPAAWRDRMTRLGRRCEAAGLVWPAEVVAELVQQYERHAAHDARFDPGRVAALAGELLVRCDAIRGGTRAVPQALIRGMSADRATDVGSARYVGLGCGARPHRGGVEISAYLQHADSGTVVAVARDFPDPPASAGTAVGQAKDYWQLAQAPAVKGAPLAAVGAGQMLVQGGRRSPDHRLNVGRARASVNPQAFAWESLRAPVLADDFEELRSRLAALPPASLRPRYVAEDLHVSPVDRVESARFDREVQAVEVVVRDARGEPALIYQPYASRAALGIEAALASFGDGSRRLRFVAGQIRLSSAGLVWLPTLLVFESASTRLGVQPWVDRAGAGDDRAHGAGGELDPGAVRDSAPGAGSDPVAELPLRLIEQVGELLLLGLRRSDARSAAAWHELARLGEAVGYDRLIRPVAAVAEALDRKVVALRWDSRLAVETVLRLVVLARLAQDLVG